MVVEVHVGWLRLLGPTLIPVPLPTEYSIYVVVVVVVQFQVNMDETCCVVAYLEARLTH